MPEVSAVAGGLRDARAARPRHRDPHGDDARGGHRDDRGALSRRGGRPDAHGRLDRRRRPHPVVAELGLPLDGRRAHRRRPHDARARAATDVWAIGDAAAVAGPGASRAARARRPPSTRSARAGCVARNVAAAIGTAARVAPFTLQDARRVRRHGQREAVASTMGISWRGCARVVPGAHLPPGDDAGAQAQGAAAGRLERRAAVRPRRVRARAARASAGRWRNRARGGRRRRAGSGRRRRPAARNDRYQRCAQITQDCRIGDRRANMRACPMQALLQIRPRAARMQRRSVASTAHRARPCSPGRPDDRRRRDLSASDRPGQ